MQTIRDVIKFDELKNLGSMTSGEQYFAVYKAVYDDYPIENTDVHTFEDSLTFGRRAMMFGKLPYPSDCADDMPAVKDDGVIRKIRGARTNILEITGDYNGNINTDKTNTKDKPKFRYKCKDFDKFVFQAKPVQIMCEYYFINYANETLYNFTIGTKGKDELVYEFHMMYGYGTDIAKEIDFFNEYFEAVDDDERQPNTFEYLYKDINGLHSRTLTMDFYDITSEFIARNYNDDLPYDKIERFIDSDESGICLLHGEPGTGKSTFIKHLIGKHINSFFYYIPSSLMAQVDENELANYFIRAQSNAVYIIEDCEALISDRNKGYNHVLPTLLNFSDGIVGGALKPKFILTFNCPISQIDKAILRKGRLKIKYDFKALRLEKAKALYPEATGPMPLCDIYNREDNGTEDKGKKRIGF